MPIIKYAKLGIAALISLVGLYGVFLMFNAEAQTAEAFNNYFKWAVGAGIAFMAVGFSLTFFGKEDVVSTQFDDANR